MANYPEGLHPADFCYMEGHTGEKGYCPRCGDINYALMGYFGAIARWAKAWGVTEVEAEKRIEANMAKRYEEQDEIS